MNICKYCKEKGMILQEYEKFKKDIKETAINIRKKLIYQGGVYFNTENLFKNINFNEDEQFFIIQELKRIDIEFIEGNELYRVTSNEFDQAPEIMKNKKNNLSDESIHKLKTIYNKNNIIIQANDFISKIKITDNKNNILYENDNVNLNKDFIINNLDNIALYFTYNKEKIKMHINFLGNLFSKGKTIMFNIAIANIKKEVKEINEIKKYKQLNKDFDEIKEKITKLANFKNIAIIDTISKGIILFKAGGVPLNRQSKSFENFINEMPENEFNKYSDYILKIYKKEDFFDIDAYKKVGEFIKSIDKAA